MSSFSIHAEFCLNHSLKNYMMKALFVIINCVLLFGYSGFTQIDELSFEEIDELNFIYDEERLAHDIYSELSDRWELSIFESIAESEKRHFEYLLMIYEKYDLPVPRNFNGFYNYPELNAMYDLFFEGGAMTLEGSLTLAANFEEYNIADLKIYIHHTQNVDLILVYNSLLEGSKNNLRVIYRNLKIHGFDYKPAILDKSHFNQIMEELNTNPADYNCIKKVKKGDKQIQGTK